MSLSGLFKTQKFSFWLLKYQNKIRIKILVPFLVLFLSDIDKIKIFSLENSQDYFKKKKENHLRKNPQTYHESVALSYLINLSYLSLIHDFYFARVVYY